MQQERTAAVHRNTKQCRWTWGHALRAAKAMMMPSLMRVTSTKTMTPMTMTRDKKALHKKKNNKKKLQRRNK